MVNAKIPFHQSLRFRMSALVAVAILGVVMSTASLNAWRSFNQEVQNHRALLEGAGSAYVAALADPVAAHDEQGALSSLRGIRSLPNVIQADITLADGSMLAQLGSGALLLSESGDPAEMSTWDIWSARFLRFELPIVKGGTEIGTLGLLSDVSDMRAAVIDSFLTTAFTALIAILIGIAVTQIMIARITRPLQQLTAMMARFTIDGDAAPAEIKAGRGETGVLADTFQEMVGSLRERDRRIAMHMETLEDTVELRTHDLRIARDEAEAANAAKSDFLATMSHEIRTPMNGMMVMAEMLSAADLSSRHRRYADIISRSGKGLLTIINDILDLSKIESGNLVLESIPVSPEALANDAVSLFWERARESNLELATYVSPQVPQLLLGDPTRLNQIITNLVNNALKFTETGGVMIRIDAAPGDAPGTVELAMDVEDTGIGIPADKIDAIFESFSQADQSTTRRFGGTGLGLSVCRKLVNAMGGKVFATSEVGRGSTFHVRVTVPVEQVMPITSIKPLRASIKVAHGVERRALEQSLLDFGCVLDNHAPDFVVGKSAVLFECAAETDAPRIVLTDIGDTLADDMLRSGAAADCLTNPYSRTDLAGLLHRVAEGALRGTAALQSEPVATESVSFVGLRVLAADDNAVNREVLREALATLKVEAAFVEDGAEAVRRAREELFDLVFMDGSMPVMDGIEATRRIRTDEAERGASRTPVIALTAQVAGHASDAWTAAGADGYVTKPFTLSQLARVLSGVSSGKPLQAIAAAEEAVTEIPILNAETVQSLDELGSKSGRDVREKVWSMFRQRASTEYDALEALAKSAAPGEIARQAHAMKSMALSAGAERFSGQLAAIERSASEGGGQPALGELIISGRAALDVTLEEMQSVVSPGRMAG